MAHRRLEVEANHAERSLTHEIQARLVGSRELGAHDQTQAGAQAAGHAPTQGSCAGRRSDRRAQAGHGGCRNAVEELLRYDSPLQRTFRVATEDFQLGGQEIRRGQIVAMMFGAANRDPEQFPVPDQLDVTRHGIHHMAFGHGIHACFGAPLARLEGRVALATLLQRLPLLRTATESLEYQPTLGLRALKALPLVFEPQPTPAAGGS